MALKTRSWECGFPQWPSMLQPGVAFQAPRPPQPPRSPTPTPALCPKPHFSLEGSDGMRQIRCCQGPWTVDLRTPPGPEGSNGSLLCICRGHPGTLSFECGVRNAE